MAKVLIIFSLDSNWRKNYLFWLVFGRISNEFIKEFITIWFFRFIVSVKWEKSILILVQHLWIIVSFTSILLSLILFIGKFIMSLFKHFEIHFKHPIGSILWMQRVHIYHCYGCICCNDPMQKLVVRLFDLIYWPLEIWVFVEHVLQFLQLKSGWRTDGSWDFI